MYQTNLYFSPLNKKRLTEFSIYLEDFTQRILRNFPDTMDFIENEKKQMVEIFPEVASCQPTSKPSQIESIEYTMKSSVNKERRKSYFGVENELKRDTPEQCIEAINTLSRAIGNAHKDVLNYSALQGDLLSSMKEAFSSSFAVLF